MDQRLVSLQPDLERALDLSFLRPARNLHRFHRDERLESDHLGLDRPPLANFQKSFAAAGAVLCLGELCHLFDVSGVGVECALTPSPLGKGEDTPRE